MSRTTVDLIHQLDEVAQDQSFAALLVVFEKNTGIVFSELPDRLERLNALVASGGEPVGLVLVNPTTGKIRVGPLEEYKNDEKVLAYLREWMDTAGAMIVNANRKEN